MPHANSFVMDLKHQRICVEVLWAIWVVSNHHYSKFEVWMERRHGCEEVYPLQKTIVFLCSKYMGSILYRWTGTFHWPLKCSVVLSLWCFSGQQVGCIGEMGRCVAWWWQACWLIKQNEVWESTKHPNQAMFACLCLCSVSTFTVHEHKSLWMRFPGLRPMHLEAPLEKGHWASVLVVYSAFRKGCPAPLFFLWNVMYLKRTPANSECQIGTKDASACCCLLSFYLQNLYNTSCFLLYLVELIHLLIIIPLYPC